MNFLRCIVPTNPQALARRPQPTPGPRLAESTLDSMTVAPRHNVATQSVQQGLTAPTSDSSVPHSLWLEADRRLLAPVPGGRHEYASRPEEFRRLVGRAPQSLQARFVRDLLALIPAPPAPAPPTEVYGWSVSEGRDLRSIQLIKGADWACVLTPENYDTVLALLRANLLEHTPSKHRASNLHHGVMTAWVRQALRTDDPRIHRVAWELAQGWDLREQAPQGLPLPVRWTFEAVAVQLLKLNIEYALPYIGVMRVGTIRNFQPVATAIPCASEADLPRATALMGLAVQRLLLCDFDTPTLPSLADLQQHFDAHPEDEAYFANRLESLLSDDEDAVFLHASVMLTLRALVPTAPYSQLAPYADRVVAAFTSNRSLNPAQAALSVADMVPPAGFSSAQLQQLVGSSHDFFQKLAARGTESLSYNGLLKAFARRVAAFRGEPQDLLALLSNGESTTSYNLAPLYHLVANDADNAARLQRAITRDPEDWERMAQAYERRRGMHPPAHVDAAVLTALRQGSAEQVELVSKIWGHCHSPLLDLAFNDVSCTTHRRHFSHHPLVALSAYVETRMNAVNVPEPVRAILDNELLTTYRAAFAQGRSQRAAAEAMTEVLLLTHLLYQFLDGAAAPQPNSLAALEALLTSVIDPRVRNDKATMTALACLSQRAVAFREHDEAGKQLNAVLEPLLRTFCAPGPASLAERHAQLRADIAAIPAVGVERAALVDAGYQLPDVDTRLTRTLLQPQDNVRAVLDSVHQALDEYRDLLRKHDINTVQIGPSQYEISAFRLFGDKDHDSLETPHTHAAAVEAVLLQKGEHAAVERIRNRVRALQQPSAAARRGPLTVHMDLAWELLSSVQASDASIPGCYAPDGCHREKPLQNGLSAVSKLVVMRDASTQRVLENAEVALTRAGLYVFRPYARAHGIDTAPLWHAYFQYLLESGTVPAVILADDAPGLAQARARHAALQTDAMELDDADADSLMETSDDESGSESEDEFDAPSKIQLDTLFPHAVYDAQPTLRANRLRVDRTHAAAFADAGVVASQPTVAPQPSAAEQEQRALALAINKVPLLYCVRSFKSEMGDYLALRRSGAPAHEVTALAQRMVAKLDPKRLTRGFTVEQVSRAWFTLLEARVSAETQ